MTPRQLSTEFLAAYNARDLAVLDALIAEDVDYTMMGGRRAAGKAEVVAAYAASFEAGFTFELIRATEEGDAIVIEIIGRQQESPHQVVQANDYHRWRDGKLVEYRAYVDLLDG